MSRLPVVLTALCLVAACHASPPGAVTSASPPILAGVSGATLSGRVMAPPGVVPLGTANVVAAGAGNVIAVGAGNFRLLALDERPLAGAAVYVADDAGRPAPGVSAVGETDAQGRFALPALDLSTGKVLRLVARAKDAAGRDVYLQTLVRPTEAGARADIDTATTLVAAALLAERPDVSPGWRPQAYADVVTAMRAHLQAAPPPDLADPVAVPAYARGVEGLRAALADLVAPPPTAGEATPASSASPGTLASVVPTAVSTVLASPSPSPSSSPSPGLIETVTSVL